MEFNEEAKPYTAFTCGPLRFYECNTMPFGASNAPATFQRLMENYLGELNLSWCVVYFNDIIFGKSQEDHLKRLVACLRNLGRLNLNSNLPNAISLKQKYPT